MRRRKPRTRDGEGHKKRTDILRTTLPGTRRRNFYLLFIFRYWFHENITKMHKANESIPEPKTDRWVSALLTNKKKFMRFKK
jgi:hypothetical protein